MPLLANRWRSCKWYMERHQRKASRTDTFRLISARLWTPPVTAREAYELERGQIEEVLGLSALVSLSDHDNIDASSRLRVLPEFSDVPISIEWTIPSKKATSTWGSQPAGAGWLLGDGRFGGLHRATEPARLKQLFAYLNGFEGVLVVFNHPKWNMPLLPAQPFSISAGGLPGALLGLPACLRAEWLALLPGESGSCETRLRMEPACHLGRRPSRTRAEWQREPDQCPLHGGVRTRGAGAAYQQCMCSCRNMPTRWPCALFTPSST